MVPHRADAAGGAREGSRRAHPEGEGIAARAYIAAGSNLGTREKHLEAGRAALAAAPGVTFLRASSVHETAPVGGPAGQGAFLNAVWEVETTVAPRVLLDRLLEIERAEGRVRRPGERWGPRTLDLDLVFYGSEIIDEEGLHVPHPQAHLRAFVLEPLAEIAPDLRHPVLGKTIRELLSEVRN